MPPEPRSRVRQRRKHLRQRVCPVCAETVSTHSCFTLLLFTHQFITHAGIKEDEVLAQPSAGEKLTQILLFIVFTMMSFFASVSSALSLRDQF